MSRHRRERDRRPARRSPFREPRRRILIVCEGEKTEPEYFKGLERVFRNNRVEIVHSSAHGVPKTLVEKAKVSKAAAAEAASREGDEYLAFDDVWCVFDVDDHPHVPDARQMARDNGIDLAISNPSFELWLLLHFRESPGMQHRDRIRSLLREHLPGYDKSVSIADYTPSYRQAVTRAARLHQAAEAQNESGRNPSTGVYRLTELIRGDQPDPS